MVLIVSGKNVHAEAFVKTVETYIVKKEEEKKKAETEGDISEE